MKKQIVIIDSATLPPIQSEDFNFLQINSQQLTRIGAFDPERMSSLMEIFKKLTKTDLIDGLIIDVFTGMDEGEISSNYTSLGIVVFANKAGIPTVPYIRTKHLSEYDLKMLNSIIKQATSNEILVLENGAAHLFDQILPKLEEVLCDPVE